MQSSNPVCRLSLAVAVTSAIHWLARVKPPRGSGPDLHSPNRRRSRSWLVFVTLVSLGLFPLIAEAHRGSAGISCSSVTFSYTNFGATTKNNSVTETVTVGSTVVVTKTFVFNGDTASDTVPITLPPGQAGPRTITAHADFYYGSQNIHGTVNATQTLTCNCVSGVPLNAAPGDSNGSAYSVAATLLGLPLVQPPLTASSSTITGIGTDAHTGGPLLPLSVTGLSINLLQSSSTATVTSTGATDESTATVGTVNVLNLVTATALKADARAFASPTTATYSTAGTMVEGLIVAGVPIDSVYPNEVIPLPGGGTVTLLEQTGTTSNAGGRSKADLSINLIHVRIPAITLGAITVTPASDVVIGHAEAHADSPMALVCPGDPANGTVSAEAFSAEVSQGLDPALNTDKVDDISIPSTGGSQSVAAHGFNIVLGGATVGSGTVSEQVSGVTDPSSSTASATATVESLCLLTTGTCDPVHGIYPLTGIAASGVTAVSGSTANGTTASSSPASTSLLTLSIGGLVINPASLKPNTTFGIPGLATVIVNEQIPEVGSNGTGDTGLTVNLLHVRLAVGGADIIVSSAHSDAHHQ